MRKVKYLLLILTLVFIGLLNVKAVEVSDKVYDLANVLTPEEEQNLKLKIDKFIETYNMDMAVVTVKYHNYLSTEKYADDFYEVNGFGIGSNHSGIIFIIDFSTDLYKELGFYISTEGEALIMYDDSRINSILDSVDLVWNKDSKDYYNMLNAFIDKTSYYASLGIPSSNKNVRIDSTGRPYEINSSIFSPESPFPWKGISLISVITSTIIVVILISRNKMVHKATNADLYIDKETTKITDRKDEFLTTNTSRVRIASASSTHSSGRVGGSSFHSSGGRFHGGGGRSH